MPTETKQKLPVIYTSNRETDEFRKARPINLRLLREPGPDLRDGMGGLSGMGPELVYEFFGGVLTVTEETIERDRQYYEDRARALRTTDDRATDPGTIEWLESHEEFGQLFFRQPDLAPPAGPLLELITEAAMDGDLEKLVEIHEEEEASYQRDEVLSPCRAAISRLEARGAVEPSEPHTEPQDTPQGPVSPE